MAWQKNISNWFVLWKSHFPIDLADATDIKSKAGVATAAGVPGTVYRLAITDLPFRFWTRALGAEATSHTGFLIGDPFGHGQRAPGVEPRFDC